MIFIQFALQRTSRLLLLIVFFIPSHIFCEWRDLLQFPLNKSSSSPIERVDFIYMINLDRRLDRWNQSSEILKSYSISPYRFSAIDGWALNQEALDKHLIVFLPAIKPIGTRLTRGGLGCSLSHLSIIQDALLSDYNMIWVMEDDVDIESNPVQLNGLIEKLDVQLHEWDMLYTDFGVKWPSPIYKETILSRDFIQQTPRFRTHSYIIKKSGLIKIWDHFLIHGIRYPIDDEFNLVPNLIRVNLRHTVVSFLKNGDSNTKHNSKPTPSKNRQSLKLNQLRS